MLWNQGRQRSTSPFFVSSSLSLMGHHRSLKNIVQGNIYNWPMKEEHILGMLGEICLCLSVVHLCWSQLYQHGSSRLLKTGSSSSCCSVGPRGFRDYVFSVCLDLKLDLVYTNLCDDSNKTVLIKKDNEFKQKYITTKKCREWAIFVLSFFILLTFSRTCMSGNGLVHQGERKKKLKW